MWGQSDLDWREGSYTLYLAQSDCPYDSREKCLNLWGLSSCYVYVQITFLEPETFWILKCTWP